MLPQIEALLVLQDRDRRLIQAAEDLLKIPKEEARAKDRLSSDLAAVQSAKDALMNAEVAIKKLELDVGTRKTTIIRLKTQQFETRKNDEFQALGNEIKRYESEVDQLETQVLEQMEVADQLRSKLQAAEDSLAHTRKLVDEDLAALAERKQRIEQTREEVRQDRSRLAADAPENILPLYEKLIKNKNGIAIVPLQGTQCGGCHMKLVAATIVKVQSATDIVQCENCGRILYDA